MSGMKGELKRPRAQARKGFISSEKEVTEWLLGETRDKSVPSVSSNRGPGRLRKLQAITGNDPNCFITQNPPVTSAKKKILISHPLHMKAMLGELCVISELIEYYDVYLWQGPETNLAESSPLSCAADFWNQREKIKRDFASKIKKYLTKQQIPVENWIILDRQGWEARWGNPSHEFCGFGESLLQKKDAFLQDLDLELITHVTLWRPDKDSLDFVQTQFPNITSLFIKGENINESWVEKNLVSLRNIKELIIDISRFKNQTSLTLSAPAFVKKLTFYNYNSLPESVQINSKMNKNLEVFLDDSSSQYKVTGKKMWKKIESTQEISQFCADLSLSEMRFSREQFDQLIVSRASKTIKTLDLRGGLDDEQYQKLAEHFPKLKFLILYDDKSIVLNIPSLEYYYLVQEDQVTIGNHPRLCFLEIWKHDFTSEKCDINFSTPLTSLKSLIVQRKISEFCDEINQDIFKFCPELEWLELLNIKYKQLDPERLKKLKGFYDESRQQEVQISTDSKQSSSSQFKGISFFSFQSKIQPQDTSKPSVYRGNGQFSAWLKPSDGSDMDISSYRIMFFDRIHYEAENDSISFESPVLKNPQYQKITQFISERKKPQNSKTDTGVFSGDLVVGKDYPLPLTAPVATNSVFHIYKEFHDPKVELGFYLDPNTQHYFVRVLKAPKDNVSVKFYYDFIPDPSYKTKEPLELVELKNTKSKLSSKLTERLRDELIVLSEFDFLFDPKINLTQKIDYLRKFFIGFSDSRATQNFRENSLQLLLAKIKQRIGVCQDRAQGFMLLALYLGLEVRVVSNEVHAFCEVRGQDGLWHCIDLGGGVAEDKAMAKRDPQKLLAELDVVAKSEPIAPSLTTFYEDKIRQWTGEYPVFDRKLLNSDRPILVYLSREVSLKQAKQALKLQELKNNYLCIDQLHDFERYWETFAVREGERVLVAGPLQKIFKEGGKLWINWSAFMPKDLIYLQSLWRDKTWNGHKMEARVEIYGFLRPDTACPPGFITSSTVCKLPAVPDSEPMLKKNEWEPLHCYLGNNSSWEEIVLADYKFESGGKIKEIPGALVIAIEKKCPLVIHDPPRDPRFTQLLEQISSEGRFFFEGRGEWQAVPAETWITISQEPSPKALPLDCLSSTEELKGEKIYLHSNNWHTLYEEMEYDETSGQPLTKLGKLAQFQNHPEKAIFYITESMDQDAWNYLSAYVSKHFPNVSYQFQWAAGVNGDTSREVHLLKSDQLEEFLKKNKNVALTSNDPDYLAQKVRELCKDDKPLLIDLTPDLGVSDLLVSVTQQSPQEDLRFKIQKQKVFKELEAGKTVILNGTLSTHLRQELAPLFSENPYLEFNNRRIKIPGRLVIVEPKSVASALCFDFSSEDYASDLLRETDQEFKEKKSRSEKDIIEKLLKFFKAAEYPHRGQAMPQELGMTWQRLLVMKRALLNRSEKIHAHNPIKGFMLDDYSKNSEYYSFLNVLCKFLFDTDTTETIRLKKYQDLLQQITKSKTESQHHAWRLLNTCNGSLLKKILGEEWLEDALKTVSSSPLANNWASNNWEPIFEKLQKQVKIQSSTIPDQKLLIPDEEENERQHTKMKKRLHYLIDSDPITRVIIIKGDPGVGKTHFLNELKNNTEHYSCHLGLEAIKSWLEDRTDKTKLLLLDEANTYAPDVLNVLKAIHSNRPVFFRGEFYNLTEQHKIVAAVNPEWYSGRHYQNLLRFGGETVRVTMPKADYLIRYLQKTYAVSKDRAQYALAGAELFKKYEPLVAYSFRDLQSLMQRYQTLRQESKSDSDQDILLDALYGEFGLRIEQASDQYAFRLELADALDLEDRRFSNISQPFKVNDQFFPCEMTDARQAIDQALLIRNCVLEAKESKEGDRNLAYKRGLLLQSAAQGIGKFTLISAMLQQRGLEAGKDYLEVTAGATHFKQIVDEAHRKGLVLIIRKLNFLAPEDERYLGHYLTEINVDNPGFLVLAGQNYGSEIGTSPLSPALCNRLQIVSLPEYSPASWCALAEQQMPSSQQANAFVQAFWHPETGYDRRMTGYDFFSCLQQAKLLRSCGLDAKTTVQVITDNKKNTVAYTVAGVVLAGVAGGIAYDASQNFSFLRSDTPLLGMPNYATLLIVMSLVLLIAAGCFASQGEERLGEDLQQVLAS